MAVRVTAKRANAARKGAASAGHSRRRKSARSGSTAAKSPARTSARGNSANSAGAKSAPKASPVRKWSAGVMQRSDAMDLEPGVFTKSSARQVALSLKRSVEASSRRKSPPFRSAMSMLNFEINRGGRNLSGRQRKILNDAKGELRKVFHRPSPT